MNTFKLGINSQRHQSKPSQPAFENFITREVTLSQMAEAANGGLTFVPSLLKESYRLNKNFISSQVIFLDFDKNEDIDVKINELKEMGLRPNLLYYSFGHEENYNKFRLVIILDVVLEDATLYKKILVALVRKVGSDTRCTSVSNSFYGGSGGTVLDADFNEWNKAKITLTGLINSDVSRATATRNRDLFRNEANMEGSLLIKDAPNNAQIEMHRDFDFEYASASSNMFDGFSNCSIELKYGQLFNLISNMQFVNGGRKWVTDKMKMRGTYKAEDFALLTDIPAYGYLPEAIDSFDASLIGKATNILALRSKMLSEVVEKFAVVKEDVNTVSNRFIEQFNKAKNSSKRISLCYAVAGLGKTEVIIKEDNVIIAVPNHKLKDELAGRMIEAGLDFVATPDAPKFDCEELTARYKELQAIDESEAASGLLKDISKGKEIEGIEYDAIDTEKAKEYYIQLNEAYNAECTVLTTHARIMLTPKLFKNKGTVIMDENPVNELLKTSSASYDAIHDAINTTLRSSKLELTAKDYLLDVKNIISAALDNTELSFSSLSHEGKRDLIEFLQFEKNCAPLKALLGAEKLFKAVYKGVVSYNYGSVEQFNEVFDKVIIVSADVKRDTFERILDEPFDFFHSGFVKNVKSIVQHNEKSYSKSSLNSKDFIAPDTKHDIIITYKNLRHLFATEQDHYYGNLIGLDLYKGHNISFVGTPIPPSGATIIKAILLRHDVKDIEKAMHTVDTKFYRFPFFTFNDKVLIDIELDDIEKELVQALGRGRTIRTKSQTELFSSFPLIECDVQQGKRFTGATELLDVDSLSSDYTMTQKESFKMLNTSKNLRDVLEIESMNVYQPELEF